MKTRLRYRKKANQFVIAVQVNVDTAGFSYQKWGAKQHCKQGDWLVDNQGDVYTVDNDTFQNTYQPKSPGIYIKTTPIWAERAETAGQVKTKEGVSHYKAGDYLVSNMEDGGDAYCIEAKIFEEMYEIDK